MAGDSGIQLRPGYEIGTWAEQKLARGHALSGELGNSFQEWLAATPISSRAELSDARDRIDVRLEVRREAPTHQWSLLMGDAIHNFRSALDAISWELAHLEGEPSRPSRVQFPLAQTEKAWSGALADWIGQIHADLQGRIKSMQPLSHPDVNSSALEMLHLLDIRDKHRESIVVNAFVPQAAMLDIAYLPDDAEALVAPAFEFPESPIQLESGALLLTIQPGCAVSQVRNWIVPALSLITEVDGRLYPVDQLLMTIAGQVRAVLDLIYRGNPDEQDWIPFPSA